MKIVISNLFNWKNLFCFVLFLISSCKVNEVPDVSNPLLAKHYYSGFDLANNSYNAISTASDGKIYYALSSKSIDEGGRVYSYNPVTDQIKFLANLTDICGEKELKTLPQGKCHCEFYERKGKLYFSTHGGYYEITDGTERAPVNLPEGYKDYPGGHFLTYDLLTGEFEDLGIPKAGEGIVTMTMDTVRNQIFAITWPHGNFIHYDLNTDKTEDLGQISYAGEAGKLGDDYRVLCRSILINYADGMVYYSTGDGDIFSYNPDKKTINKLNANLRIDYFGKYDSGRPGSMSYNWRRIFWYPPEGVAYGVHGNSGYLFRFDPSIPQIELVERITSEPSKSSGMFDQFSYGYLGYELGPDGETIYYLTGGPIYRDGRRIEGQKEIGIGGARGLENLHLITYNIPEKKYTDHGAIFYEDGQRPTWVNSIAIDKNGYIYTLALFEYNKKLIQDLTKITDPFSN